MGIGLATLVATGGEPCIKVADSMSNIRISGLLLQAGKLESPSLLQFGTQKDTNLDLSILQDVFARVGGPDTDEVKTKSMIQINSSNVIIDDTWLWRADHDVGGLVANGRNPVATGLEVNGDGVIAYGLASEHTLGHLVDWKGNDG